MKTLSTIVILTISMVLLIGCEKIREAKNSTIKGSEKKELSSKVGIESKKMNENSSENFLSYIDIVNEITISHTDDKYGEWGGDTDLILIFSDGEEIFAKYSRYLGSIEPPLPPNVDEKNKNWYDYQKLEFVIDSIKLNQFDKELIEKAICELLNNKLRNPSGFPHSGINNSIVSKDSSLIIMDYPSIEWKYFQKLKSELRNK